MPRTQHEMGLSMRWPGNSLYEKQLKPQPFLQAVQLGSHPSPPHRVLELFSWDPVQPCGSGYSPPRTDGAGVKTENLHPKRGDPSAPSSTQSFGGLRLVLYPPDKKLYVVSGETTPLKSPVLTLGAPLPACAHIRLF